MFSKPGVWATAVGVVSEDKVFQDRLAQAEDTPTGRTDLDMWPPRFHGHKSGKMDGTVSAGPKAYTRYDELIVSSNPIPAPKF